MMDEPIEFQARIMDPKGAMEQLDGGARIGEVDVMVAAFGIPDTGAPHGVGVRQVIDQGSFRSFIENRNTELAPVPYYVDHGHAMVHGFVNSLLKIGKSDKYREEESGLKFRGLINLRKDIGRDVFSDMIFDPVNTPHSFRWTEDHTYRGSDGYDHVDNFSDLMEVSYVGRGAQMATGIMADSLQARAAIAAHTTETYDGSWDGSAMVARMPDDAGAGMLRMEFAWVDPSGDPSSKSSYKFPHHTVTNGKVDGANVTACRAIIANLNGARSTPSIPAADRRGVYAHAAKHLRDAGEDNIAPLRATMDEITSWAEDPEFGAAMREALGVPLIPVGDAGSPRNWLDAIVIEEMRTALLKELAVDADARAKLRALAAEAEQRDPGLALTGWYDTIWSERTA